VGHLSTGRDKTMTREHLMRIATFNLENLDD
jgi:hypothetical protein